MKLLIPIISASVLMVSCTSQKNAPTLKAPVKEVKEEKVVKTYAPPAPKKNIKLKEVEDTNFSSEYMYPETKSKKPSTVTEVDSTEVDKTASNSMSRGECIAMISQEKFDKYTQMLGDEAFAIKRCQMLKAM